MLKLDLRREPYWLEIGGDVAFYVRPATTAVIMAARAEAGKDAAGAAPGIGATRAAFLKGAALAAILDWRGVVGADDAPLAVTPEAIGAVMDLWQVADQFETRFLGPAYELDLEKNVSSPSPAGTGAGAPVIAVGAPAPGPDAGPNALTLATPPSA